MQFVVVMIAIIMKCRSVIVNWDDDVCALGVLGPEKQTPCAMLDLHTNEAADMKFCTPRCCRDATVSCYSIYLLVLRDRPVEFYLIEGV